MSRPPNGLILRGPQGTHVITKHVTGGSWAHDWCNELMHGAAVWENLRQIPTGFPMRLLGAPTMFLRGSQFTFNGTNIEIVSGAKKLARLTLRLTRLRLELETLNAWKAFHR